MLLDAETVATVGSATLGGVEVLKRFLPGLLPKVPGEAKTAVFSVITGVILKLAQVAGIASVGWLPLIVSSLLGAAAAGVAHDKIVAPMADPILNKIPGQESKL